MMTMKINGVIIFTVYRSCNCS